MKLPYLNESKWPISKEPEEKVANPSYEMKLEDHLIDQLMMALEHKDVGALKEAMVSLIHHISMEE